MRRSHIIALLVLIVIILGGLAVYALFLPEPKNDVNTLSDQTADPEILSFAVEQPYLVARTKNAVRVRIMAVPTGTGITEEFHAEMGQAEQVGTDDRVTTWRFRIPDEPVLATDMYAVAVGEDNDSDRMSLSVSGASDIYETLWGTTNK